MAQDLMKNCPICKKETEIKELDLHMEKEGTKFYDKILQCAECLCCFRHIFRKQSKDKIPHISAYIGGISFIYQNKEGEWYW